MTTPRTTSLADRWRRRRRRRPRDRVLAVLASLALLGAVGGVVFRARAPQSLPGLFLAAVSPYFAVAGVLAVVLFIIVRGRGGWIGAAVAVAVLVVDAAVLVPRFVASAAPASGHDVVVLTANLKLGSATARDVVRTVDTRHVDVLMLEELTSRELTYLREAGLDTALPYSLADPRNLAAGTGLWSRTPIDGAVIDRGLGFSRVTATIRGHDGVPAFTAVALHVAGPDPANRRWLSNMARLPGILDAFPLGMPTIVAGDFNATPDVAQFRHLLRDGYHDAGEQAGAGWLPTFPADSALPPVIGIDHVLTRGATALSAATVSVPGSDHRALTSVVRLPN